MRAPNGQVELAAWRGWPWLALLVLVVFVYLQSAIVVNGGGQHVWTISSDSWKNIYTFVYHALHDSSMLHTEALHWPWGEHAAMADAQPLLSTLLQPLAKSGLISQRGLVYVVMMLPLLSLPLLGWFLYVINRRYGMSILWASAWALASTLLYPQVIRNYAHFALSYGWMMPGLFLLWWNARDRGYVLVSVFGIGIALSLASLIHFYNLGVGGAMIIALLVGDQLFYQTAGWKRTLQALAVGVVFPLLVSFGVTALSDAHLDRVSTPYGLSAYKSKPDAHLVSKIQPHWEWFSDHVISIAEPTEEGYAYIGVFIGLGLLLYLGVFIRKRNRSANAKPAGTEETTRKQVVSLALFAGLLTAIYSWGFPMAVDLPGFDTLRELTGPLKQLRSLGRFAWATYYCWAPVGALGLMLFFSRYRWGTLALLGMLGFSLWEGVNLWESRPSHGMSNSMLPHKQALVEALEQDDVSAVVPLPFYHVGSEDFGIMESYFSLYLSTYTSLSLGKPNAGLFMSRTSFGQAVQSIDLTGGLYNVPDWLLSPKEEGKLAITVPKEWEKMEPAQRQQYTGLLQEADLRYENEFVSIYVIQDRQWGSAVNKQREAAGLYGVPPLSPSAIEGVVHLPFDDRNNTAGIGGSGGLALAETTDEWITLYEGEIPSGLSAGATTSTSFRLRLTDQGQVHTFYTVAFFNAQGEELSSQEYNGFYTWQNPARSWFAFEALDVVPEGATSMKLRFRPSSLAAVRGGVIDEVVIRQAGIPVRYYVGNVELIGLYMLYPSTNDE